MWTWSKTMSKLFSAVFSLLNLAVLAVIAPFFGAVLMNWRGWPICSSGAPLPRTNLKE